MRHIKIDHIDPFDEIHSDGKRFVVVPRWAWRFNVVFIYFMAAINILQFWYGT